MGIENLPEVSIDLRLPRTEVSCVKINGELIGGVQALRVEMDAEKNLPTVYLTIVARHVRMELPHAEVKIERPVVMEPTL
jgi:hypothetical protein